MHLCAIDDEKGPQLYKADPSGHYFGWKASAIGAKDQEANNCLEKVVRKNEVGFWSAQRFSKHPSSNCPAKRASKHKHPSPQARAGQKETIQSAIDCLQVTLSQDLKASDIEVGVATADGGFKLLRDEEVDQHLTEIAERDE